MSSTDAGKAETQDSTTEASTSTTSSQINAYVQQAKGTLYNASSSLTPLPLYEQTIGSVSSDPTWKEQGQDLLDQGTQELQAAQQQAKSEAAYESVGGKLQSSVRRDHSSSFGSGRGCSSLILDSISAYGFITGDQKTASEGNKKAEAAEWKAALADDHVPQVSLERAKGKVESAVGMVTGDIEKQQQANLRAEKAAWTGK
ncbi:BZ3500_MvSof-1268-A1-R1_Chr12-1g03687 [Microbotryum saponariae]|uniref:BZ3500_MvSof-1268-A1-R1_Chr12-1g03687 protein n=1 Tax=Microbotryum saponariae TaxID=289078 RepID=A0A2X0LJB5_9BASI|nr:BZ3500_MvSof-1268-A1-R1_Chr12-1g03687 [Microbotryum saponariae]SDA05280.1 BZ3501_MvSof-1269-A2-R1_Chr12-1g03264 [Microbotryum saponariae]